MRRELCYSIIAAGDTPLALLVVGRGIRRVVRDLIIYV